MCRRTSLNLPPSPDSAGQARTFLAATILRWELPELRDDLLLAVSELVTNAVLHARTPMSVHAAVAGGTVEVGVRDTDPAQPKMRAERTDLVGDLDTLPWLDDADPRHPTNSVGAAGSVAAGRGLHLLDAVADSWGVTPSHPGLGKEVWFSLPVPEQWPYTDFCTCSAASGAARTAGGRPVLSMPGPWQG